MDNAAKFSSKGFNDYCLALEIQVKHFIPYVHTQNGLAEYLIKRIKLIARPTSCWSHAVLHAADLTQLHPTAYHVRGDMSNIFHLRKFDCAAYVAISLPKHTSMGPHRKLGIYVGYQSPLIIKYPLIGDLFTARYADCIFNKDHFSALGGDFKYQTNTRKSIGIPVTSQIFT